MVTRVDSSEDLPQSPQSHARDIRFVVGEDRFHALLEAAPDAMVIVDPTGHILALNQQAERLFGYPRDELLGGPLEQLLPESLRHDHAQHRHGYFADPQFRPMGSGLVLSARRKDGSAFPVEISLSPLHTADGILVISAIRDIRARNDAQDYAQHLNAESELRARERTAPLEERIGDPKPEDRARHLASFPELNPNPVLEVDVSGRITYANPATREILEQLGLDSANAQAFLPADIDNILRDWDKQTALSLDREIIIQGRVFGAAIALVPQFCVARIYALDITQHRQTEEALRASEKQYRSLFDHMLDGFAYCEMLFDEQGHPIDFRYLDVNTAFETLTGLKNVTGKKVTDVIPGIREQNPELFEIYGRVAETGQPEHLVLDFKPLAIWLSLSIYSPSKGYFAAVFDNITERKRSDEALRESEEKYRTIVETAQEGIWVVDGERRTTYVNRRMTEMLGCTPEEMIGRSALDYVDAQSRTLSDEHVAKRRQGVAEIHELKLVRKDGSPLWTIVHATPRFDPDGQFAGSMSLLTDITERKQVEQSLHLAMQTLRESEERVLRLNEDLEERAGELEAANEELERLATSLALDLRSPLVSLRGVSHVLTQDYGAQLPPQAQPLFQLIDANAEEMEGLTQGLLKLMHVTRQTLRKQELDTEDIVRAALTELQPERAAHPVEITVGDLPACRADPLLLKQVWVHLLSNALQATRARARAHIEIGARPEENRTIYFVKDNGLGFDMSYAGTIFRAFHRYHRPEEWKGSGVGLAIVDSIVRRHGGRVWAESAVNAGATFFFEV